MRDDFRIPDLTFPSVQFGKREAPWDLRILLYKGGAKVNARLVASMIDRRELNTALFDRLDLVQSLHAEVNGRLVGGGSRETANNEIRAVRRIFAWAEDNGHGHLLALDSIQSTYLAWADSLVHRVRIVKDISENSIYSVAALAGNLIDRVLERGTPIIHLTRLSKPSGRKTARGVQAEKQNLQQTIAFGHVLQDVCDGLPIDVTLRGALPIRIRMRTGAELVHWSSASHIRTDKAIQAYQADGTLKTRYPLANLRIEAELMMFIGQTSMNLAQTCHLRLRHFFYVPHLDGYQVRDRKHRRGGEVLFEVFKDYKAHFERYLAWRRELFPDADLLFPFLHPKGATEDARLQGHRLRGICKKLGTPYISPRSLRNTRVNWLLRRSADPDLTAEMTQSTKETLLHVYERPSLQRAMGEVMRFWVKNDPQLARTTPIAPGECNGQPKVGPGIPKDAPEPDCIRPSGCLWCEHHRDIDSQDYVWSLASFWHLKTIELSRWRGPLRSKGTHPAQHAIERITEKLRWFYDSNEQRRYWLEEAHALIDEGNYHPAWKGVIDEVEVSI